MARSEVRALHLPVPYVPDALAVDLDEDAT
jgi:hypothetical protein